MFSSYFGYVVKQKVLLIGLGPHCKRIYIAGLKRFDLSPALIIDIESKRRDVEAFVRERGLASELFFIPDEERDATVLSDYVQSNLDRLIVSHQISHAIISTEPKAHYAYLQYLIIKQIPTLTDKPITSPVDVINNEEQARKISAEYHHLLSLAESYNTPVVVQCQRRYDPRYRWIIDRVGTLIHEYALPVSHIHITHCDGSLNMPDEFFSRENHPYKYGYGKLFHSGYHFIDLANLLLSYDQLSPEKRPSDCLVTSSHYSPHDQLFALDESFYLRAFKQGGYSTFYDLWRNQKYLNMGELDMLALFEFSRGSQVVTTCSLNLLQSGFTRRAWTHLPIDNYKGNGRVRHETLSLQMGPLMNIQVHSYQAYEIKERNNQSIDHQAPGGLEHFDIHIFRNSDIIGGLPHEIVKGSDLFPKQIESSNHFIGYNEYARAECLSDFLNGREGRSNLQAQMLTIDMVTNAYISMCRKRRGEAPVSKFKLTNQNLIEEHSYGKSELCSGIYCRS
ncbi:MAG: hypothetical protein COT85_03985 [Chlamydiae bacterium CG10_big_fil_rev_8_21_14_0_10_42_34]|nr:MAG: hypothetical protein COT85_03985 [Chlamydiae bacterium CG10_big_fil_rev_8_21_14_0_10_42_34]